jgi:hypothetical protein
VCGHCVGNASKSKMVSGSAMGSGSKSLARAAAKSRKRAACNIRARGPPSPTDRTVGVLAGK